MSDDVRGSLSRPIILLTVLISLEAIAMLFVAGLLLVEVITEPSLSLASSIALFVLALIGTAFLASIAVGIVRAQSWTRGAAIVWQVLQAAVAVVILQGDMADAVGWVLAIAALLVLLLIFARSVTEHLRR